MKDYAPRVSGMHAKWCRLRYTYPGDPWTPKPHTRSIIGYASEPYSQGGRTYPYRTTNDAGLKKHREYFAYVAFSVQKGRDISSIAPVGTCELGSRGRPEGSTCHARAPTNIVAMMLVKRSGAAQSSVRTAGRLVKGFKAIIAKSTMAQAMYCDQICARSIATPTCL